MKKKTNRARLYSSPLIDEILEGITPLEMEQSRNRMLIAARIDDCMQDIGLSKIELARKLNKQPSEITKWLSGTHNFTMETLTDIAFALSVPIADLFLSNVDLREKKANIVLYSNNPEPPIITITPPVSSAVDTPGQTMVGEAEIEYGPTKEYTPIEKAEPLAAANVYSIAMKGIELLNSSLVRPATMSEDLTNLQYNIKIENRIDKDKKLVFIIVHVRIISLLTENEVGTLVVNHIYDIADFDEIMDLKEGDKFSIPLELTDILNSISISSTRGMMFSTFKGTFLHHAVLPIVNPKHLTQT